MRFALGCDAAGDEDAMGGERFGSGEGLLEQVAAHSVLETGDEINGPGIALVMRRLTLASQLGYEARKSLILKALERFR